MLNGKQKGDANIEVLKQWIPAPKRQFLLSGCLFNYPLEVNFHTVRHNERHWDKALVPSEFPAESCPTHPEYVRSPITE